MNFLQDWCFSHNALADQAAVAANQTRDGTFWDLHERHCQATAVMSHYNCLVQTVQLRISQEVVREEKPVLLEAEVPEVDEPHVRLHWTGLPSLQIPPAAVRWYGDALVVALSVGFGMVSRRPTVLRFGCLTFSSMLTLCLQRETLDPCDSLLLANGRMDEMCLTLSYVDLGSSNARVGLQKCGKKFCDTKVLS